MESVINFLADYYIWFFVAAGVLCFALIGFIIESKKKNKNTFKGESIENTAPNEPVVSGNTVNMEGATTLSEATEDITNNASNASEVKEPEEAPTEFKEVTEDTMEINDIPLKEEEKTPIEFYNEPSEIKKDEPVINEIPEVNVSSAFNDTPVMEIPTEPTNSIQNEPVVSTSTPKEPEEEIETLNIFEDLK